MSECTDACAEFASCEHKATASASCARGFSIADCTDAECAEYATCKATTATAFEETFPPGSGRMGEFPDKYDEPASAACGLAVSDCNEAACAEYATCQKKATASLAACGIALSDCTDAACGEAACCQQAMAFVLSWGPTLEEKLNWAVATAPCGMAMSDCTDAACAEYATCQKKATGKFITRKQLLSWGDPAEARPCTDGDDDSQYGPSGDDQKCTDDEFPSVLPEGQYWKGIGDGSKPKMKKNYEDEGGEPGSFNEDELDEENRLGDIEEEKSQTDFRNSREYDPDDGGSRFLDEDGIPRDDEEAYDPETGLPFDDDVPEGYQEVDTEDPMDPEGGDWESVMDEDMGEEMDLKKTMKEEDKAAKQEKTADEQKSKEQSRTAISIPRDPSLEPNAYHQFWDAQHGGHSGVDEQRNFTLQKAVQILEDRVNNPRSPEDAEAAKRVLMNGPKAGGTYQKTRKAAPGEPGAEDFIEKEDRSPIV
jgi:hypothetical protein